MSVSSRILRGTGWMTLAGILARLGTFTANLIVIRLLGLERVGQLGLIESWLSLIVMFALFGTNTAVTRHVAYYQRGDPARIGALIASALGLGIVLSLIVDVVLFLFLFAQPAKISASPFELLETTRNILAPYAPVVMVLVVVSTLRALLAGLIYGLQAFSMLVWVNIVTGVISLPLSFFLVQWRGLGGALDARLLLGAIEILTMLVLARSTLRNLKTKWTLRGFTDNSRLLLGFGAATFAGQFATNPVQTFMTSFLATQTGGIVQVGLFTAASRLVGLANFLPGSMATVIMPVLAREHGKGDLAQFGNDVVKAIRMMWASGLPVFIFFMAISSKALVLLYGPAYARGASVAFLFLFIALLGVINQASESALAAANRQWISTATNLVWAVMFLVLGLFLVPVYLASGYAISWLISMGIYLALELSCLRILFAAPLRLLMTLALLTLIFTMGSFFAVRYADSLAGTIVSGLLLAITCLWMIWRRVLVDSEQHRLLAHLHAVPARFLSRDRIIFQTRDNLERTSRDLR